MNKFTTFVLLSLFESSQSCGGFFCALQQPVLQAGETIAFGVTTNEEGNRDVVMQVQINYEGPAEDFSWILPVMFNPNVTVGSDVMFNALFQQSLPNFVLTFENDLSETCDDDNWLDMCIMADSDGMVMEMAMAGAAAEEEDGEEAIVLQQGSVGPFDFVVLEPAEEDPGLSVFTWLDENGYDQPEEAFSLIDYYAQQDQLFLALRLQKGTETGEIQPIVLEYTMPGDMQNVACVPIQLTSIAATPDMPIQVYMFSDAQAFPVNYFAVELDDTQADWLGCQGVPNCYIQDMRARFAAFLEEEGINSHAFITEYAGPAADIVSDAIALNVTVPALLENSNTPREFLEFLASANVPSINLVHSIIEEYIPNEYNNDAPSFCSNSQNVYQTPTSFCYDFLNDDFDAGALAEDLNQRVFEPAAKAQEWVNSYPYMTRFYGQLSPNTMDKDPFFAFNDALPDVTLVHEATAVPICQDGAPVALSISVGNNSFVQEAEPMCGTWQRTNFDPLFGGQNGISTATQAAAFGYTGEPSRILLRDEFGGQFPPEAVAEIVRFMDSRVPNQTITPYTGTFAPATPTVTAPPTSASSSSWKNMAVISTLYAIVVSVLLL